MALEFSAESETTKAVCKKLGFKFDIKFVETAVADDGHITVAANAGRIEEIAALRREALSYGYSFRTKNGGTITPERPQTPDMTRWVENFRNAQLYECNCLSNNQIKLWEEDYIKSYPKPAELPRKSGL